MKRKVETEEKFNHSQIVKWIEDRFKKKEIYRDLEECREFQDEVKAREKDKFFIYPRLSIDLILVKKVPEPVEKEQTEKSEKTKEFNHYTLFFAISSKEIFEKAKEMEALKGRLSFYQFYLSRISEPRRIKIIVVVPHCLDVPEQRLKFFKESGFGLWRVNIEEQKEEEEVYPPKSLQERMTEEFKASVDDPDYLGATIKKMFRRRKIKNIPAFKEAIKDKKTAEDFASFFERYIRKSVDAIAGVKPGKFGMRYIDRRLLNLILELEEVSYIKKLKELANQHLDEDYDDYAFVSEVFSALWEEEIGIPYSRFLKTFEPALLHVFPVGEEIDTKVHRDHYIHQFQVFLLGLYIIDKFKKYFTKCKKPRLQWLIISSFHDMAYPVQLYDEWSKKFFQEVFRVSPPLARIELESEFVDQNFLSCMGYLICSLYKRHKHESLEGNWIDDKDELVQFFYQEITKLKNHCVLSSISLLKTVKDATLNEKNIIRKKISNGKDTFAAILKDVFAPSALAIALHDKGVWQQLRKESDKDDPRRILDGIEFSNDPLSFLLIFCDNIQEWGRPSESPAEEQERKERAMTFRLKDIKVKYPNEGPKKQRLDVTIWTPQHERTEQFFINKFGELTAMQFFLRQPLEIGFTIHLEDKDGEAKEFEMESSLSEESIARSE